MIAMKLRSAGVAVRRDFDARRGRPAAP